jgi:HupE/UreJ protein
MAATSAGAHPVPFSYLDIQLTSASLEGTLILHDYDVAHDLGLATTDPLLDARMLQQFSPRIISLAAERLTLVVDGTVVPIAVTTIVPLSERSSVQLSWRTSVTSPGRLVVRASMFPYDPNHQTFVNIYENGRLRRQDILDQRRNALEYYTGTRQGAFAVFRAFTASGIHHIAIGPDHILFIIGLLLLGGTVLRLLGIVSAFTLGHSITLSLATLGMVTPPARVVEPAIALSIVYVGADNLLAAGGRDTRAWIALFFGLVHGFGFASVLREISLPPRALGISLFSFNLGVEIGQAVIVVIVASILAFVRTRSPRAAQRLATAGSVIVVLAGAYWFVQRVT